MNYIKEIGGKMPISIFSEIVRLHFLWHYGNNRLEILIEVSSTTSHSCIKFLRSCLISAICRIRCNLLSGTSRSSSGSELYSSRQMTGAKWGELLHIIYLSFSSLQSHEHKGHEIKRFTVIALHCEDSTFMFSISSSSSSSSFLHLFFFCLFLRLLFHLIL